MVDEEIGDLRGDLRIVMTVGDYERTVDFYRDVLGLPVVSSWGWEDDDPPGTLMRAGGGTIEVVMAHPERPPDEPRGFRLMLRTSDPDQVQDRFEAAGIEVLRGVREVPWGYRELVISDPNGVRITLYTVVDEIAAGHA